MKLKCQSCGHLRDHTFRVCPICNATKAFCQEPKLKDIEGKTYHLEETLKHKETGNEYQIKEIQKNGFVSKMTKGLAVGAKAYIGNENLKEYEK